MSAAAAAPRPYGPRKGLIVGKPNTSTAIAPPELKAAYTEPASLAQMDVKPIPLKGPASLAPARAGAGAPAATAKPAAAVKSAAAPKPAAPARPTPFAGAPPELKPAANRYVPAGKVRAQIDKVEGKQYTEEGELLKDEAGELILDRKTNPLWYKYEQAQLADETTNPYYVNATIYMPPTRMDFTEFIYDTYRKTFTLPRQGPMDKEAYVNACKTLFGAEGGVKSFLYQEFVREYIRQSSPYRGILVYHGLGSGKTCSSIAAAEALYGIANKRIIVMTPFSLRANFINEISFCGFRHYQLNNHWVPLNIGKSASARVYARSVLGLGDAYVTRLKEAADEEKRRIWLPDFSKEPNYKSLTSDQQSEIRAQINEVISNRIIFVNYNGVPYDTLNTWACTPGVFDNAVIVVDEIHNLIRLMQGAVDKFVAADPANPKSRAIDPVRPGQWEPLNCEKYTEREMRDGSSKRAYSRRYNRGILFYRLLCGARNSKIIGLSGTPIINFPEELGILSNVLAGYIDSVNVSIRSPSQEVVGRFAAIAHKDPRIDIVRIKAEKEAHSCLLSVFPEGYVKVEGSDGTFLGVKYDEDAQEGIEAVYARVKAAAVAAGIPIAGENFVAYPRLPPDAANFRKNFVSEDMTGITNKLLLKKRLTGLISYYKGSKEEYMPRINMDVEVTCPMSNYALQKYTVYRKMEIEEKGTEVGGGDIFAIGEEGGAGTSKKTVSSYRFKTRAACNFVFPKSIERPLPGDGQDEIATLPDLDVAEGATDAGEDAAAIAAMEQDEAEAESVAPPVEEEGAGGAAAAAASAALETASVGAAAVKDAVAEAVGYKAKTYKELLAEAMRKLYESKDVFLKLDGATEEGSLKNYSAKLDAMLRRIEASPGSNLVYSQFSTVEGLGVLAIALQANGYKEIRITGSATNPQFTAEAEASIRKGPGAEKRYITFTGEGTKEQRALVLNIFNGNIDKLPGSLASVLKESGYEETRNLRGELCWVIGITGAGAEGISLKCCRSVHIFEPYWNMVRLDQVKGRAIRICSHADLPYDERTVDIYTYISTFSDEQLAAVGEMHIDYQIQLNDKNKTTDQIVLDICKKKDAINKELLTVMKEVAVDCTMNGADNEPEIQCFDIAPSRPGQYMFDPDIEVDKQMTAELERTRAKTVQSLAAPAATVARETGSLAAPAAAAAAGPTDVKTPFVLLAGTKYYIRPLASDPDTLELFDSTDTKLRKPVGTISKNPATGKYKRPVMFDAPAGGAGAPGVAPAAGK